MRVLLRLCNLSECLIWTRAGDPEGRGSIALVELPQLHITFRTRQHKVGGGIAVVTRLYCDQYAGLHISNRRDPAAVELLKGIPNAVLLENRHGDLYVLLSAAAKPVPAVSASRQDKLPSTDLIFDRSNRKWLANLGEVCRRQTWH